MAGRDPREVAIVRGVASLFVAPLLLMGFLISWIAPSVMPGVVFMVMFAWVVYRYFTPATYGVGVLLTAIGLDLLRLDCAASVSCDGTMGDLLLLEPLLIALAPPLLRAFADWRAGLAPPRVAGVAG